MNSLQIKTDIFCAGRGHADCRGGRERGASNAVPLSRPSRPQTVGVFGGNVCVCSGLNLPFTEIFCLLLFVLQKPSVSSPLQYQLSRLRFGDPLFAVCARMPTGHGYNEDLQGVSSNKPKHGDRSESNQNCLCSWQRSREHQGFPVSLSRRCCSMLTFV